MNNKPNRIDQILKKLILSIFIAIVIGLTTIIFISEYHQYRKSISFDKKLVEDEKKLFIKIAVENVISYLNYVNEASEKRMHEKLREVVNNAHTQAQNIYDKNVGVKSISEIEDMVRESLRGISSFNKRGYVYIIDMDGVLQMHPYQTSLEGRVITRQTDSTGVSFVDKQVELMKVKTEALQSYDWPKAWLNDSVFYSKTTFLKKLEPLGWIIGCGEYVDDHVAETQKMALEWLQKSYSADDWNLFINNYDGTSIIINSTKYKAGVNIKEISDDNGLQIFKEELEIAQSDKPDFLYYNWPAGKDKFIPKVAYISGFDDWNWMVGASSSLEQFDEIEMHKTKSFYQSSGTRVILIFLFAIPFLIYIFYQLRRNRKLLSDSFSQIVKEFEKALASNKTIKSNQFEVEEFQQLTEGINKLLKKHFGNVKALAASEEKFRVLVENAPVVIVGVNDQGLIKVWNKQSESFFNLKKEQVLDQAAPINLLFPEEETDKIRERMYEDSPEFKLVPIQLKTGKTAYQYWASFRVSENLIIWVGNDVSALKEAEAELSKSRNFLNTMLESIPSPVFYKDKSGKYLGGNQAFFELIGKKAEDVVGKGVYELYNKELADIYYQKDLVVFDGINQKYDAVYGENSANMRNFTFYKAPFRNEHNEVVGLIGIMLDITERIKIEEQLKQSKFELEKLNATKDKFFSIIAHDLINPFNTMLNAGELLTESLFENNIEEARKLAEFLNPAIQRGYDLLLNLLEWSRTQTGTIKFLPKEMLIGDELRKSILLMQDMANLKSIELVEQLDFNPLISFDANMLRTIVRNLISNAIKFTNENGKIVIRTIQQDKYLKLSIEDNGVGMDKSKLKTIFTLNKSESSRGTRGEQGTGLGIVLVKEFVEKHRGKICVNSQAGAGTVVHVLLPLV